MNDTLYIIGNGFDLHHGLKTAYSNFRDNYVKKNHKLWKLLYDIYGDTIKNDMWWSNFEIMLGHIDYLHLMTSHNGEAIGFMKVRNLFKGLLPPLFGKWIKDMNCLVPIDDSICLNPNALFFSFNYTLLLEETYGVKSENIWHIHNSIKNVDDIVVGHDFDERKLFVDFLKYKDGKGPFRTDVADNIRNEALKGAKQVNNRIYLHQEDFARLYSNIRHYITMGFSFNEIDMPYIKEILNVNKNISKSDWTIYYHGEGEDKVSTERIMKLGVNSESIGAPIKW